MHQIYILLLVPMEEGEIMSKREQKKLDQIIKLFSDKEVCHLIFSQNLGKKEKRMKHTRK